jgi:lipopolysaccharide transport system ATP-binding protein
MKPIIEVENVSKRFQLGHLGATTLRDSARRWFGRDRREAAASHDFWALRDVSFRVQPGEIVGIIGRNGAGKSTLLKVLSRITEPTEGRIKLRGRIASLLEVGTGFHPDLTGRENIFLNGAILGMRRAEIARKFDDIVEFAEVGEFLDTPVKRYSSGMYVRLAFAVAAHLEPEILVVDEVLAVGDAAFQKKCLGKMGDVARHGRTVLFVSHNMGAVRTLCQTGLLFERGRLLMSGPAQTVLADYLAAGGGDADFWSRPANEPAPGPIQFDSASARVEGIAPRQRLLVDLRLTSTAPHRPVFLWIDLLTSLGVPILQAVPDPEPFMEHQRGEHQLRVTIDLPPLVPDRYSLTLWTGPHCTEPMHIVERALSFEIEISPQPHRTFGHSPEHGFLVPPSSVAYVNAGHSRAPREFEPLAQPSSAA